MVFMVAVAIAAAILIFIYFNRYLEKRRNDRREYTYQKRQELLDKTLAANKDSEGQNVSE